MAMNNPNKTFSRHVAKSMLVRINRVGPGDYSAALQGGMIEPADAFVEHRKQLLNESPRSIGGPLATLLADAYMQARLDA